MENPIKVDDLGVPLFSETSLSFLLESQIPPPFFSDEMAIWPRDSRQSCHWCGQQNSCPLSNELMFSSSTLSTRWWGTNPRWSLGLVLAISWYFPQVSQIMRIFPIFMSRSKHTTQVQYCWVSLFACTDLHFSRQSIVEMFTPWLQHSARTSCRWGMPAAWGCWKSIGRKLDRSPLLVRLMASVKQIIIKPAPAPNICNMKFHDLSSNWSDSGLLIQSIRITQSLHIRQSQQP